MKDYAVMHCNAELHCYAVINVDKSTVAVGRQVNAFRSHYDWLFGISIENTVRITCVSMRYKRENDMYKNAVGSVYMYLTGLSD